MRWFKGEQMVKIERPAFGSKGVLELFSAVPVKRELLLGENCVNPHRRVVSLYKKNIICYNSIQIRLSAI